MAKYAYIGVSGIARKIKKMWGGVDGVAHKVKKAWIGVNGVARLFFSGQGATSKYGTTSEPLRLAVHSLAAASTTNHALFGGGYRGSSSTGLTNYVTAYDTSLTRSAPTNLGTALFRLKATSLNGNAFFTGGNNNKYGTGTAINVGTKVTNIYKYNPSLTQTTGSLTTARDNHAVTSIGNRVICGGGGIQSSTTALKSVEAFDESLTSTALTDLTTGRAKFAATTVGNYALFAFGTLNNSSISAYIEVYDSSLTKQSNLTSMSDCGYDNVAVTVGNYAVISIGQPSTVYKFVVVDKSLTVSYIDRPWTNASYYSELASSTEGYAFIGGGYKGTTLKKDVVAIDESLTVTNQTQLNDYKGNGAATSIGNYVLFGGGANSSGTVATVEVYQVI